MQPDQGLGLASRPVAPNQLLSGRSMKVAPAMTSVSKHGKSRRSGNGGRAKLGPSSTHEALQRRRVERWIAFRRQHLARQGAALYTGTTAEIADS
jgi:hypothetical protein